MPTNSHIKSSLQPRLLSCGGHVGGQDGGHEGRLQKSGIIGKLGKQGLGPHGLQPQPGLKSKCGCSWYNLKSLVICFPPHHYMYLFNFSEM